LVLVQPCQALAGLDAFFDVHCHPAILTKVASGMRRGGSSSRVSAPWCGGCGGSAATGPRSAYLFPAGADLRRAATKSPTCSQPSPSPFRVQSAIRTKTPGGLCKTPAATRSIGTSPQVTDLLDHLDREFRISLPLCYPRTGRYISAPRGAPRSAATGPGHGQTVADWPVPPADLPSASGKGPGNWHLAGGLPYVTPGSAGAGR